MPPVLIDEVILSLLFDNKLWVNHDTTKLSLVPLDGYHTFGHFMNGVYKDYTFSRETGLVP